MAPRSTQISWDGYDSGGAFCELRDQAGAGREARLIQERIAAMRLGELVDRAADAEQELFNLGITFTVYTEREAIDRILPFDLIPRVISAGDWQVIESGVKQRVAAINLFLDDVYHGQKILKNGVVPAELVLGNVNFRKEMIGLDLPHRTYAHICGIDLVRGADGKFYVLEDNARTPSTRLLPSTRSSTTRAT
jgi:uncharacterized circularly permuted ATP-grasp superfamily protein